jgi:ABC-type sugar transport system ATPase subunit
MRKISKSFGAIRALRNVSISIQKGEVHVLVGENGAGKSTILKILSGVHIADSGEIYLRQNHVFFRNPQEAQQAGVGMVYQELTLMPEMTVAQNIFLNSEPIHALRLIDKRRVYEGLSELGSKYKIGIDPEDLVGELPLGKKQIVEIMKVLVRNPEIIIFDEPTSALNSEEVKRLHDIIDLLRKDGKTVIYTSHRLAEVFSIGDRATVLKDGVYVETVELSKTTPDELVRLMVGRPLQTVFPKKNSEISTSKIFEVVRLEMTNVLHNISFDVKRGQIIGIAGLQGHGQSDLFNCIAGLAKKSGGRIFINSKEVRIDKPRDAIRAGIAFVPEDRKTQALLLGLSIKQNISVLSLFKMQVLGFIRRMKEVKAVESIMRSLSIRATNADQLVRELSGGNQQKVVLGKGLTIEPKVLMFNEPTRGIDVETKQDFYQLMRKYASNGVAIIMYSSDLLELIGMSDIVIVMYEGRITGVLERDDLCEENIMRCAMGLNIN